MKIKYSILLVVCYALVGFSNPNESALSSLRTQYLTALRDYLNAPKVYELFLKVGKPTAKILAYQGALKAIITKTTWNIFKKMSYLNKSEESFKLALKKAPNDIEIRFMRLTVQYEIPEYLGYSEDMGSDKAFVIKNIAKFRAQTIPPKVREQIVGFVFSSQLFTATEIEKFKLSLAIL